jgi:hypothetical protein
MDTKNLPRWVRWIILGASSRSVAMTGLRLSAMTLLICLSVAAIELNRDTVMGKFALYSAIAGGCFVAVVGIWLWRAIVWLDRHYAWPRPESASDADDEWSNQS